MRSNRRGRHRPAFTLIELLVVIAVIATLASVVAPAVFRHVGDARSTTARSQIQTLTLALDSYRLDMMRYPTTDEGIQVLRVSRAASAEWRGPYLRQEVPPDPWGRPFIYRSPGAANPDAFDLYSLGRDGRIGGVGEDADVTSWNGVVVQ